MSSRKYDYNGMYYFALCLLIIRFTLMGYRQYIELPVFLMAIPLLLLKVIGTRYTREEIVKIILVVMICGIATVVSKQKLAMWSGLVLIASKGIDYKKMFRYCFYTQLLMLAAIIIIPFFTGDEIFQMIYRSGTQQVVKRYQFGIGHPNGLQFLALQITITYMGMKGKLLKKQQIVFFAMINTMFVILSKSRTSYGIFWLAVLLIIMFQFKKGRYLGRFLVWTPVVCVSFCILCTRLIVLGGFLIQKLDSLFEHRLIFASRYIAKYPFNVMGHYIFELTLEGAETNTALDCGYINLSLNNGLLMLIPFILLFTLTLNHLYKTRQYAFFLIGVLYSVYFIMEGALLGFYKDLFIIMFGLVLFRQRRAAVEPGKGLYLHDLCTDNRRFGKPVL